MPKVLRTDPLRNFKFRVAITPHGDSPLAELADNLPNLGFAQMSGIAVTNEVIPYREGGMNTHPHKMVGQSDFAPVSLARGVFASASGESLYNWQRFLHAWQGGVSPGSKGGVNEETGTEYRCTVTVSVYDHPVTDSGFKYDTDPSASVTANDLKSRLTVNLYNAWPGSYSISDLNAGDNGILIQQMQLHHEGFEMDWAVKENA
jgi:phage tail-like protein